MEQQINRVDGLLEKQLNFFGKDKALTILINQKTVYERTFQNEDVIEILTVICKEFDFSYDELVHSHDKSWQRVWAVKFCSYYLHKVRGVNMWIISYVLSRSKTLIYRFSKEVDESDDKIIVKFKTLFDKKLNTKP